MVHGSAVWCRAAHGRAVASLAWLGILPCRWRAGAPARPHGGGWRRAGKDVGPSMAQLGRCGLVAPRGRKGDAGRLELWAEGERERERVSRRGFRAYKE